MLRLGQLSAAFLMAAAQYPGPPAPGPAEPPGLRGGPFRAEPGRPDPGFRFGRPPVFEAGRLACLSNPETRDAIQSRHAVPPFRAVAEAMREGGDLVMIRLCRFSDPPLVYDVAVLRRDNHLVHVLVDAASGLAMAPPRRTP